jgi:hypothetical protein
MRAGLYSRSSERRVRRGERRGERREQSIYIYIYVCIYIYIIKRVLTKRFCMSRECDSERGGEAGC